MIVHSLLAALVAALPMPHEAPAPTGLAAASAAALQPAVAGDSVYRAARERLTSGDYRAAADLFSRVATMTPQSPSAGEALYWEAFALSRTGSERDLRRALSALDTQRSRFPDAARRGDAGALAARIRGDLARRGNGDQVAAVIADARGGSDADAAEAERDAAENDRDAAQAQREASEAGRDTRADYGAGSYDASKGDKGGKGAKAAKADRGARGIGVSGATSADCRAGDDENGDVRIAALTALLQMDDEQAMPILDKVLARRDSCSEALRRKAVFLVAQKHTSQTADILLRAARSDPDAEVRRQAVFWLSEVHTDRAVSALDSILHQSDDRELRERAIFALANGGDERGLGILKTYVGTQAPDELRAKAVFWLGQNGRRSSAGMDALRARFATERSEEVRQAIVQAASEAGGDANEQWLLGLATDKRLDVEARKKALFWAGQRRSLPVASLVAVYDRLDDREMKEHAIFVLSERRETAAADKLIAIARTDPDKELRNKALFWLAQHNDPRAKALLLEIIDK